MSASAMEKSESFHVQLRNGDSWISLSIHLGEEFTGGAAIRPTSAAKFVIYGGAELSSSYATPSWPSGVSIVVPQEHSVRGSQSRAVHGEGRYPRQAIADGWGKPLFCGWILVFCLTAGALVAAPLLLAGLWAYLVGLGLLLWFLYPLSALS